MEGPRYREADTDTLVTETRKGDFKYWLSDYDLHVLARCPSTLIVDQVTDFEVVSTTKNLKVKLGLLRKDCKRWALAFNIAGIHWIAVLMIRQESSKWRSYVADSKGPTWYYGISNATLEMLDLHKYLTSIGSMIDVSDNQQEDAWNCGMYTLRNLRTLIECLNKGGEPSFGILKPAADESAFFRNLRKQSAWEMQQLITEHNDNLASILSPSQPPPLPPQPPPLSQIPPCQQAVIGCISEKTERFVTAPLPSPARLRTINERLSIGGLRKARLAADNSTTTVFRFTVPRKCNKINEPLYELGNDLLQRSRTSKPAAGRTATTSRCDRSPRDELINLQKLQELREQQGANFVVATNSKDYRYLLLPNDIRSILEVVGRRSQESYRQIDSEDDIEPLLCNKKRETVSIFLWRAMNRHFILIILTRIQERDYAIHQNSLGLPITRILEHTLRRHQYRVVDVKVQQHFHPWNDGLMALNNNVIILKHIQRLGQHIKICVDIKEILRVIQQALPKHMTLDEGVEMRLHYAQCLMLYQRIGQPKGNR